MERALGEAFLIPSLLKMVFAREDAIFAVDEGFWRLSVLSACFSILVLEHVF